MKIIKGFENEDIVVSDFGEWVGKDYIDYKAEYERNQKFIEILLDENKKQKNNWDKLKEWLEEYIETNEKWYSSELSNHDKEYYKKDYIDSKFWLMKFQNQMQEIEGGMNG